MSMSNDLTTLNGLFKQIYADKIQNLIPEGVKLLPRIKFAERQKQLGDFFHTPVVLGLEHGVTFASESDGAFALNDAIAGAIKDATVRGTQLVLRSALSYSAASRSVGAGPKAFEDATKFLVKNMMRSLSKKLEVELLYGQMGYGVVDSIAVLVINILTAEWAPGIWAGSEGMRIEIRSSVGALRGFAYITAVDLDARSITVDVMPAGVVATDIIHHYGAYGKEFAGIHKIASNTGILFGIDAAQYSLWKGNISPVSPAGPLSYNKISDALARAVEKGLEESVVCVVNPKTWSDLMTDQAANRRYDTSYKPASMEQGSEALVFHSQNGKIEIISSIYCKEGYAYLAPMDELVRVGSTDITFRRPGQGDEFFRDLENNAGYELRAYTDQALFCMAPGKLVIITGIIN